MILKESEIDQDAITAELGKPYKVPGKLFTATGSSYYFVRQFADLSGKSILLWDDSKAIFQRFEKGLAVYVNRSNYQRVVLLPFHSIRSVQLEQLIEYRDDSISTSIASKIASKLGGLLKSLVGIPANIKSRETILKFKTDYYIGQFSTSYSSFKSEVKYFSKLGLGDRFTVREAD